MQRQNKELLKSIIKTLAYAEIFSYAMTASEIHKYLISKRKLSFKEVVETLENSAPKIKFYGGYFALRNVEALALKRQSRYAHSKRKLARAFFVGSLLAAIPTVKLVGVSGSLSMMNADTYDDIDLFIITRRQTLWMTRFIVTAFMLLLKQKRRRSVKNAKDKICLNMFMAEDALAFEKKNQNLYIAHEIAQLKVVFDRGNTHLRLLGKNKWALRFMANSMSPARQKKQRLSKRFIDSPISFIDKMFFFAQKSYMKRRLTREVITKQRAGFHPQDQSTSILELYDLKCSYHIPLAQERKHAITHKLSLN